MAAVGSAQFWRRVGGLSGALALSCGLSACSDSKQTLERSLGGYDRVELSPVEVAAAPAVVEERARIEPFAEQAQWTAEPGSQLRFGKHERPLAVPMQDALWVCSPAGAYEKVVARAAAIDLADVNQVAFWVSERDGCRVVVDFLREGRVVTRSTITDIWPSDAPHEVSVYVPPLNGAERRADALRLHVYGGGEVGIRGIVLESHPAGALVSEQPGEELVFRRGDGRRSMLVSTSRGLKGSAAVGAGSRLTFAFYQPARGVAGKSESELVLRVRRAGVEVQSSTWDVDPDTDGKVDWIDASLALGSEQVEQLEFEFSLTNGDGLQAVCAVADVAVFSQPVTAPPSVLFVTSDTHRADFVAIDGRPSELKTPGLADLAARGLTFTNCWSATNVTNPSHITLMTGESPRDTGVVDNTTRLADSAVTLAEQFRALGYRTWAAVSARHLRHDVSGLGQGFDRMSAPYKGDEMRAQDSVDIAERWLDEAGPAPVFMWLHVFDAHAPYAPPEDFAEMYWDPTKDPRSSDLPETGLPERIFVVPALVGVRDLDYPVAQYRGEVSYLDSQLKRMFELPRFRAGLIAFTGDHGESFGEHGIYYGHAGLYPQTIHVPLILVWPGAPAGTSVDRPVQSLDIGRTLLDIVGGSGLPFGGQDLRPAVAGGGAQNERPRFALSSQRFEAAITLGKFHLLVHLRAHDEQAMLKLRLKHEVELYDIVADPLCEKNLVEERPQIAQRLHRQLVQWLSSPKDLGWTGSSSTDPELAATLARLGYTSGDNGSGAALWKDDDCAWCRRTR